MSLDWDISKVENHEKLCWKKNPDGTFSVNPVTDALVWACLAVGMPGITETNWKEFAFRIAFDQILFKPYLRRPNGRFRVTTEDVRRHIGLSTNTRGVHPFATQMTRAQFVKQKLKHYEEEMFK